MSVISRGILAAVVVGSVAYASVRAVSATVEQPSRSVAAGQVGGTEVDGAEVGSAEQDQTDLIVHEWGTFTNYSGSDGIKLEFRPLLENDLPGFVSSRFKQSGRNIFSKATIRSIQRMETPVTYFYTPVERDVDVRVLFPNGLLTEFYPPARKVLPAVEPANSPWESLGANPALREQSHVHTAKSPASFDIWKTFAFDTESDSRPSDSQPPPATDTDADTDTDTDEVLSSTQPATEVTAKQPPSPAELDWGRVHLIPPTSLRPDVEDEELARRIGRHVEDLMVENASRYVHYGAAREVDAAMVQVRHGNDSPATKQGVLPGDYFEKFLFYRGVGSFQLPLQLTSEGGGKFALKNDGDETIRSLFLVSGSGDDVRFHVYDQIAAGATIALEESEDCVPISTLGDAMTKALVAEGLYEKEAKAMVKCWKGSWFAEPGTRLLYMVPQTLTDSLLPLEVSPKPHETVRVLVGRMEIMTIEEEGRITKLVEQSQAARAAAEAAKQKGFVSPVLSDLLELDRFAEPALVRTRQLAHEPAIQDEARQLIADLRQASKQK